MGPNFNEKITQKWDLWIYILFMDHKIDKRDESQPLPATVHMNSSRCPLNECAVAEKKKKKVWRNVNANAKTGSKPSRFFEISALVLLFLLSLFLINHVSFYIFFVPSSTHMNFTFLFYIYLCSLPNDSLVCYNLLWFFNFLRSPII